MSCFEDYFRQAEQLEREILRKGLVLGINWDDETEVCQLAHEAIEFRLGSVHPEYTSSDPQTRIRVELFGLAQLMLTVMRKSAEEGMHTHGGPVWKVFGRALYDAARMEDDMS
jgi:hypothetical protein